MPAALNAANEEVVSAFLAERVPFCRISSLVEQTVERLCDARHALYLEERLAAARDARAYAKEIV